MPISGKTDSNSKTKKGENMNKRKYALAALLFSALAFAGGLAQAAGITVLSREDGSGTRSAFTELFGIKEKTDLTTDNAEITNATAVMMASVAGNKNAIGYLSLGSLNNTVKALSIDGVAPAAKTVKNGRYPISRPFILAFGAKAGKAAQDFLAFILSKEGQAIVEKAGYIGVAQPKPYEAAQATGKIVAAGSSSVTPVMEKLKEAYLKRNPGVTIEIQLSDSTTGLNAARDGICDIGMASRELKQSERNAGLKPVVIAKDGIAVIVNQANPVNNLSREQVKKIYTGSLTDWSALAR